MTTVGKDVVVTTELWFAQNSLPLWLKWQPQHARTCNKPCCDLLKIHYLCGWNDNAKGYQEPARAVVICSKFITFVVEMTTACCNRLNTSLLWFAQNSLPLWLKWQPAMTAASTFNSCDLLKIHYLCGWNDNFGTFFAKDRAVVICSKFITFVVEMTTVCVRCAHLKLLWFAQNSLPLWLKWQRSILAHLIIICCDLLKIHYLCGWNDNFTKSIEPPTDVVICSKFITFVVEMTTVLAVIASR